MTDEIEIINLRENLRPNNSRYFIKENILPVNFRSHTAEIAFYILKMLYSLQITRRTTPDK